MLRCLVPLIVFVAQASAFVISHEGEKQYHRGTLIGYAAASLSTRLIWPVVGWLAYVREDAVVLVASVAGSIVGDLIGAARFIRRRPATPARGGALEAPQPEVIKRK